MFYINIIDHDMFLINYDFFYYNKYLRKKFIRIIIPINKTII